jgi:hypothetical protein
VSHEAQPEDDKIQAGRPRKYPYTRVGDHFGETQVVIALARRRYDSNERVRVRCEKCGHEKEAFVFNLRVKAGCNRCKRVRRDAREGAGRLNR